MQKFYSAQKTVKGAVDFLQKEKVKGIRFNYDKSIYDKIFDKLKLKQIYMKEDGTPTQRLNIIDFNARLSPFTYYLNTQLKPQHHLLYPDGQSPLKFWNRMETQSKANGISSDDEMRNFHVLLTGVSNKVKANILTKPLALKLICPDFLPQLTKEEENLMKEKRTEPINKTLLVVGDFLSTTQASSLRTCIYYNEVRTSMFRYGGVKFLAWTTPNEVLKYLGPLGSIHRRTNAMMANLYSDVNIIACSETLSNPKAERLLCDLDYVKIPIDETEGEVCLVEFQSNHYKYNIQFPDELHLIIHKLFCTPGARLDDKLHVLGPGADSYLRGVISDDLLDKKISMITNEEFIELSENYYYWPFKPDTNLETYANADTFMDAAE